MSDATETQRFLQALIEDYAVLADSLGAMNFRKELSSGAVVTFTFREAAPKRKAKKKPVHVRRYRRRSDPGRREG